VNAFFAALQFLTIFPVPKNHSQPADELARAAIFFPVIGFLLGAVLVIVDFPLKLIASSGLSAVVLVSLLAWLTGGLHLDGLSDTFDALGAGGDRQRMLRIMDDSHVGAFGLIALVLLLFFKIQAIQSIDTDRWRALLAAPVLGRWAMLLLGYRSLAAKPGLGSVFIDRLETKYLLWASLLTLIFILVVLRGTGIALMVGTAVVAFVSKAYFHRRLGGVTGDTLGALSELSEASVLVFLALGAR
jgi:adenosylcobinamide-GDP ribazoletransferase